MWFRLLIVLAVVAVSFTARPIFADGAPVSAPDVELFTRSGCPRCDDAHEYTRQLLRARPALELREYDVQRDGAARKRLEQIARASGATAVAVPAWNVKGKFIVGFDARRTPDRIQSALAGRPDLGAVSAPETASTCSLEAICEPKPDASAAPLDLPLLGRVSPRELGLPLLTLVLGLVDGFNPCAMWVLLFLLSMLATLRDRRRMLLIAGIFLIVSGAVYFAFMAAWLNAFLLLGVSRWLQVALGVLALAAGIIHTKDFFALHRGISLSIPEAAKPADDWSHLARMAKNWVLQGRRWEEELVSADVRRA
jgi:glutaredoxin